MNRRSFLSLMGSGGAGLATGCASNTPGRGTQPGDLEATTSTTESQPGVTNPVTEGLALADRVPRSLARTSDVELDVTLNVLAGEVPTDWVGHSFFIHAVPQGDVPVFTGEGKVTRLDFSAGQVDLTSRLIRTPDHYADVATANHPDGFDSDGFARFSMTIGFRNFPNTALVSLGGRLLATTDAGRPWELDPVSLEPITPVGWTDEWRGVLPAWMGIFVDWPFPQHLTSAHCMVDHETREMFTINYGIDMVGDSSFTNLVGWDGMGDLTSWTLVDRDTGQEVEITQSVHQIALTRNHVIVMDTAFLVEIALIGEAQMETQNPFATLWIIRREDLGANGGRVDAMRVNLAREAAHFHADFDDSQGIVLHVAHGPGTDPSEMLWEGDLHPDGTTVPAVLQGLPSASTDLGAWGRVVIDPGSGEVLSHEVNYDERFWGGPALVTMAGPELQEQYRSLYWLSIGFAQELRLKRVENAYANHPYREIPIEDLPTGNKPSTLVRVNCLTTEIEDDWAFPAGRAPLSPVFVPRANATDEHDGYIVCTVISDDDSTPGSSGDEIWVFDAADLAFGPICRLGHPDLDLPFTLHTLWMAELQPRTATYHVDLRSDISGAVSKLAPDLQAIFESEVYPHFE